jgi:hypothetical protein
MFIYIKQYELLVLTLMPPRQWFELLLIITAPSEAIGIKTKKLSVE